MRVWRGIRMNVSGKSRFKSSQTRLKKNVNCSFQYNVQKKFCWYTSFKNTSAVAVVIHISCISVSNPFLELFWNKAIAMSFKNERRNIDISVFGESIPPLPFSYYSTVTQSSCSKFNRSQVKQESSGVVIYIRYILASSVVRQSSLLLLCGMPLYQISQWYKYFY